MIISHIKGWAGIRKLVHRGGGGHSVIGGKKGAQQLVVEGPNELSVRAVDNAAEISQKLLDPTLCLRLVQFGVKPAVIKNFS